MRRDSVDSVGSVDSTGLDDHDDCRCYRLIGYVTRLVNGLDDRVVMYGVTIIEMT